LLISIAPRKATARNESRRRRGSIVIFYVQISVTGSGDFSPFWLL